MEKDNNPETILEKALELTDPQERVAYLDEACGNDAAQRDEIESLLAAHEAADAFMATLADPLWQETASEKEGDRIGRYKLLQQIGEGGFGTVYLAEQTEPVKRRVALKVIKAGMDSKEVIARFEAERQALALMDHPNIAKVHDAGTTEGGRPYFVMELVKGVPLTKYCADKHLDTKARLGLFIDVCAAVQHAHQKGIIHRDLKPSNILVSPHDGKPVVKVIDFGIAKAISMELTEKTIFTQMGRMMGTPQYMSPEQAELNALDVDTRSDIYSLGVVLYELLTGSTPLDGEQLRSAAYGEMQRMIREETPPKPSTRVSTAARQVSTSHTSDSRSLRGDLDWIVMKALEKERDRRYETANGFAADIRRFLNQEPVSAGPPGIGYKIRKFVRRNRTTVAVAAAIIFLLVAGIFGTSWFAVSSHEAQKKERAAKEDAIEQADRAEKAEADALQEKETARQALAKSQLDLAEKEFERGKFVEAQKILVETPESFRDANWRFLQKHSSNFTGQLSFPGTGGIHQLQFLPEGDRFSFRCFTRTVRIYNLAGHQIGDSTRASGHHSHAFGIDRTGGRIAFPAQNNSVAVKSLAEGKVVARWPCDLGESKHVLLSPDGETAIAAGNGQIIAYGTSADQALWTQPFSGIIPAFSPDGRFVAVLASKENLALEVQLLDVATGKVSSTLEAPADNPEKTLLQFNRDGSRLACLGGDEAILWNPKTGVKIRALHFPGETVTQLSPGGEALATVSGSRIRLWDTASGQLLRSLNGVNSDVLSLAFSPDGKLLLSSHASDATGKVYIWPTRLVEEVASVRPGSYTGRSIVFENDNSGFYACAQGGAARWNFGSGLKDWEFSSWPKDFNDIAIHPTDGSLMLSEFFKTKFTHISSDGEALEDFGGNLNSSMKFNRTGQLLLALDNPLIAINPGWAFSVMDYPAGKILRKIPFKTDSLQPFGAFCIDDTAVATAALVGGITVWDWRLGTPLRRIAAAKTRSIACLASSPDGRHLLTGGPDRWIRIWEAATGRLEIAFRAHWEGVNCVKFSPDGRDILSGSDLGMVRIHDASTGEEQLSLYGLSTPVVDVAFSPDGTLIAAITKDGFTKVWNRQRSTAASLLPQGLTEKK